MFFNENCCIFFINNLSHGTSNTFSPILKCSFSLDNKLPILVFKLINMLLLSSILICEGNWGSRLTVKLPFFVS